jgi:hypothetical protein
MRSAEDSVEAAIVLLGGHGDTTAETTISTDQYVRWTAESVPYSLDGLGGPSYDPLPPCRLHDLDGLPFLEPAYQRLDNLFIPLQT